MFSLTFYLLSVSVSKTLPVSHSRLTYTLFQDRQKSTRFDSPPALFQHSCMRAAFMKLMPLFWPCCRIPSVLSPMTVQPQPHQQAGVFIHPTKEMSALLWNVSMAFLIRTIPRFMQLDIFRQKTILLGK